MANANTPDPKFAKFKADGKLKVDAFLTVFESLFLNLSAAERVTKLANYLDGEPFNFYATSILTVHLSTRARTL